MINFAQKHLRGLTRVIVYLMIFYLVFLLGRSLWTNYTLEKSITKLEEQIAALKEEKKTLENLNLYYQTDSFKELEARKKLGWKAPGEKSLVISATPTPQNFSEELTKEKISTAPKTPVSQIPNWALWWEFFTK